jgi:hypothetical protein
LVVLDGASSSAAASRASLAYAVAGKTPTIWVADADGTHRRALGTGAEPLLSPDGRFVAAVDGGGVRIFPTGPGPVLNPFTSSAVVAQPLAWSPDSRYLAVSLLDVAGPLGIGASGLAVLDTRTGSAPTIAHGFVSGASFAPAASNRLVYDLSGSRLAGAAVNLFRAKPDGTDIGQLTRNGRSLNPVWGRRGIAFDREAQRGVGFGPTYQLFLLTGRRQRRITNVAIGPLAAGLVPVAVSANGTHLLAEFIGTNQSAAWAVDLAARKAGRITISGGRTVVGGGISRDGRRVLAADGDAISVPFGGGPATVLVRHATEPSWNR